MLDVIVTTNIVYYLMAAVGVIGVIAKLVSHVTLKSLVRASSNMSKSTHRLIKLIRSKYDHASMIHDTVENVDAFVEKFIYEYRTFGFKIHTWRQLEEQSIIFAGVLAAIGAVSNYITYEFGDATYRYIGIGLAEMILLFVLMHMTDEDYKIDVMKAYIVDYLENVCAPRYRKMHMAEGERLSVIGEEENAPVKKSALKEAVLTSAKPEKLKIKRVEPKVVKPKEIKTKEMEQEYRKELEPEPEKRADEPSMREDAIRQILEEFLA
ncbi:MAG: hypothetical protein PHN80_09110 [Hespellia sp.]|nr:hypothetical protein [Hespellia sp.]